MPRSAMAICAIFCAVVLVGCGQDASVSTDDDADQPSTPSLSISSSDIGTSAKIPARAIPRIENLPPPTGKKITLKLNLESGASKHIVTSMDLTSSVSVDDQTIDMNAVAQIDATLTVVNVDSNGIHDAQWTFDRMRIAVAGGKTAREFDTDDSSTLGNSLGKVLAAFIGESLTLRMTSDGQISSIEGIDELAKKIGKQNPDSFSAVRQQLNEVKNQMGQMMATLPGDPVDNGDSWSGTIPIELLGESALMIDATFTLVEQQDGIAIIHVDGKPIGKFKGIAVGELEVDIASGWTKSTKMKIQLAGKTSNGYMTVDSQINLTSN